MKRIVPVLALLWAISICTAHAAARDRTPSGSFLKYRAATVGDLVSQVKSDAVARARYARHFGVDEKQIIYAFGSGVKLVSLSSPTKVRTWYVDKNGKTHTKSKLLPRGTLVFAGSDGKPLLAWSCGNPLRAELPQQIAKAKQPEPKIGSGEGAAGTTPAQADAPTTSASAAGQEQIETKVLAEPVETIGTEPLEAIPGFVPAEVAVAEPMVVAQALPMAAAMPAAIAPAAVVGGGFSAIQALGGLAGVLGGIAAAVSLGGDDDDPKPPVVPPVPEPAGVAVLITGTAMGLSITRLGRSRRR